jgi:N-carbamoyl-L-amino-acid hydrolase
LYAVSSMVIPNLKVNGERLRADFDELSQIGATPDGGVDRLALSAEDLRARSWFADRIEEAGLQVRDDDAANLSGVLRSSNPDAKTLMIGSHLDSVPNGGRYDGAIGVLAALECLRTIRETGISLPVHLEAINFTDDEGCWKSLFGVRAMTGHIQPKDLSELNGDTASFRAALTRAGIDPRRIFDARRDTSTLAGYLELHIEQGQRLERERVNIGVVTGIVGRKRYEITFFGQAGHSGTTDMYKRRDALRGAALFIVRAHDMIRERYGDGVFNCGDISVKPGIFNVIPSEACLTTEIRHADEKIMADMEMAMFSIARECSASYSLEVETKLITHMPAATMAAGVIQAIEESCEALHLSHRRMISYSGHSAQILSQSIPCGMIFIPSVAGISHHPREFSHWDDVVNGANVLLQTVLTVAMGG